MIIEKEKTLLDYLGLVSPGSPLRNVIDDLTKSNLGAMIVFDSPPLQEKKLFEGGFKINCKLTPQKIFELCKMDGALIISSDMKRILYANVLMTPSSSTISEETGTRHKAAERIAKQANTFVITVSERRRKTTIYFGSTKYTLRRAEEIINSLSPTIQILEKQREIFDRELKELNILEISDLVSTMDVCMVLQKAEIILKTARAVKKTFIELGREGNIMNMRYRELLKGVEEVEDEILRDYSFLSLHKSRRILSNITFEGLLDLDSIARLIIQRSLDANLSSKGYRFLERTNLSDSEIPLIVERFKTLKNILLSSPEELEPILRDATAGFLEEIRIIKEHILGGEITL